MPKTDPVTTEFSSVSGITDVTILGAIDYLVKNLKANGLWAKANAVYPIVGGTSSTHRWNLRDLRDLDVAFRLTFFGGLTHNSNGITGNGINGYASTNLNTLSVLSRNNVSAFAYSQTSTGINDESLFGQNLINQSLFLNPRNATDQIATRAFNTNPDSISNSNGSGFFGVSRNNASTYFQHNNGNNTTISRNSETPQNADLWMLRLVSRYATRNINFMWVGSALTESEAITLRNIVQQFQTLLSREV